MSAPKGSPKHGGRKKGTPNKSSLPLEEKALELGVDPFTILLLFAKADWAALGYASPTITKYTRSGESYETDIIEPDHRLKAASEACQYLYPKRKAIEVREAPAEPERPLEHLSDQELDEL